MPSLQTGKPRPRRQIACQGHTVRGGIGMAETQQSGSSDQTNKDFPQLRMRGHLHRQAGQDHLRGGGHHLREGEQHGERHEVGTSKPVQEAKKARNWTQADRVVGGRGPWAWSIRGERVGEAGGRWELGQARCWWIRSKFVLLRPRGPVTKGL